MRRTLFLIPLILVLTVMCGSVAQVNAACPSVSCATNSNGDICDDNSGAPTTFGCTIVTTSSTGTVQTAVAYLTFDCAGNITAFHQASNNNGSGTTFSNWASKGTTGTYCLNNDDTGYIFPPSGCPYAIMLDAYTTEVRMLDTTPNTAGAGVCEDLPYAGY